MTMKYRLLWNTCVTGDSLILLFRQNTNCGKRKSSSEYELQEKETAMWLTAPTILSDRHMIWTQKNKNGHRWSQTDRGEREA